MKFRIAASVLAGLLMSNSAMAKTVRGAVIPNQVSPVIGDTTGLEFVVQKSMNKAIKELERTYKKARGVTFRKLRAPLRVRAYLIENFNAGRTWDAIAVYQEGAKGSVYLTVLPRAAR